VPLRESVVTIVGMGLMGGSLGMALVRENACRHVRALVRREETARDAVSLRAAHDAVQDPQDALNDSDLVVIATPVRTIERQVSELAAFMRPGSVMTDMGSVKRTIVDAMKRLPQDVRAIGGHPMCGKETSGIQSADPDLFRDKVWVMTPVNEGGEAARDLVTEMIASVAAKPVMMPAEEHDVAVACISHLPYLLACTLVGVAEETGKDSAAVWELASSGFKDTSRVAAGDLTMMMDILSANTENVLLMLGRAGSKLARYTELLLRGHEEELTRELAEARDRRTGMFPGG